MVRLEYWNGEQWVHCGTWHNENIAWVSLGGDDQNYRTVDNDDGTVLTDKRR